MRIPGTPTARVLPPNVEQVADIIAEARIQMPRTLISLGCARQRGNSRLEELAIDAGINRMALPSEEAVGKAKAYGLNIQFQPTCCSVVDHHAIDGTWLLSDS
jgi:lipoyl synthase